MSGNRILLDTNAFIYFFEGQPKMADLVVKTPGIYYSVITEIELLSATHLSSEEITQIKSFLSLCQRVELTTEIVEQTIAIRRQYRLKVPDAIVAASVLVLNIPLVSADTDFQRVDGLDLISDILQA